MPIALRLARELLDAMVEERLEDRLADQAMEAPAEQVLCRPIGRIDPAIGVEPHQTDAQLIGGLQLLVELLDGRARSRVDRRIDLVEHSLRARLDDRTTTE